MSLLPLSCNQKITLAITWDGKVLFSQSQWSKLLPQWLFLFLTRWDPWEIPVSPSTCCGFGCHLSLLCLRRPFWEVDSLVYEGRYRKGPGSSDKPMVHPASHLPWLCHMYFPIQPCPWDLALCWNSNFHVFAGINGDDFCWSYGIFSPKRWYFFGGRASEGQLVTFSVALLWLRHSGDSPLSCCFPTPKKPGSTNFSVKVRSWSWKLSHSGATLLKLVVVTAVGCLGESSTILPHARSKGNRSVSMEFIWFYLAWKKVQWSGLSLLHLLSWILKSRSTVCASGHCYRPAVGPCSSCLMATQQCWQLTDNTRKGHQFPLPLVCSTVPPFWP